MHTSTNGQHKHKLEKYTDDTVPTIKAPPLSPYSSYPPPMMTSLWRVLREMALTFGMFLYVCCAVLTITYFRDNWYRDEVSRIMVLLGVANLVTGAGIGIGLNGAWRRYKRKDNG